MKLTYIFHSGFALETGACILVFDYWKDPANVVPSLLESGKPLYVFSSHFHEDHFNREIFGWKMGFRCLAITVPFVLAVFIFARKAPFTKKAPALG